MMRFALELKADIKEHVTNPRNKEQCTQEFNDKLSNRGKTIGVYRSLLTVIFINFWIALTFFGLIAIILNRGPFFVKKAAPFMTTLKNDPWLKQQDQSKNAQASETEKMIAPQKLPQESTPSVLIWPIEPLESGNNSIDVRPSATMDVQRDQAAQEPIPATPLENTSFQEILPSESPKATPGFLSTAALGKVGIYATLHTTPPNAGVDISPVDQDANIQGKWLGF